MIAVLSVLSIWLITVTLNHSNLRQESEMADCGCGRSPTGQCIGWHNLTEEEYQEKLKELERNNKEQDED